MDRCAIGGYSLQPRTGLGGDCPPPPFRPPSFRQGEAGMRLTAKRFLSSGSAAACPPAGVRGVAMAWCAPPPPPQVLQRRRLGAGTGSCVGCRRSCRTLQSLPWWSVRVSYCGRRVVAAAVTVPGPRPATVQRTGPTEPLPAPRVSNVRSDGLSRSAYTICNDQAAHQAPGTPRAQLGR